MTPEQQRIAIAEACGWRFHPISPIPTDASDYLERKAKAIMCWVRPGRDSWQIEQLPDYLNDLNAMHQAEKLRIIGTEHESDYCMYLYENAHQCFATAAQRAEAFLRTLNLWTI